MPGLELGLGRVSLDPAAPRNHRATGLLQRLSQQLSASAVASTRTTRGVAASVSSGMGAVQATIPYRKATKNGDRLVFIPDGNAYDMRPHPVEDLRELGESSLLTDGFVMMCNVSRANTALLCPRAEALEDPDHLREVAAERLTYRHEMEALARESFPGHTVRLVMAGGPMGEDGVPNGNVFTRMSETPPGVVGGPEVVRRGGPVKASGIVHSDLGAGHGPHFEQQLLKTDPGGEAGQAQRLLQAAGLTTDALRTCRHIILQLWRPITDTPVQMDPLAVLDPRSLAEADLYGTGLSEKDPPDGNGLNPGRFAVYNPQHRWVHISNQTRDEVLVYAGYDSGRQPMRPLFHTSVTVPYAGEGEPEPRISADAVVHVWLDA